MRWLAALLVLLGVLGGSGGASAQTLMERLVTPGPLASPHARLEDNCSSCHVSFERAGQNTRCLDCHDEIRADISGRRKFHGRYAQARTGTCSTCHSDHLGRNFNLITFNRARFNHDLTDYPLEGGHARVRCADCHGSGNNYRGTTTTCVSCHRTDEPHRQRLGRHCQDCHQVSAWTRLKPFNHLSETSFALSGSHATTTCMSCHRGERWQGIGTACVDCHRADDSHRGTRGTNCGSCHRTSNWTSVTFDHDSTGFPLAGGHAAATCASCHGANNANRQPARNCNACHATDDVHEGANGTECQDCHTVRSWAQVRFDHDAMTEFPLRGAHRRTTCEGCHREPPRQTKPPGTCIGCHTTDDTHEGRNGEDCARCHGETNWTEVDFNHDTMTDFPLLGAHAATECETCHTAPAAEQHLSGQCIECHREDDIHTANLGEQCESCHDSTDWTSNVRFDHDLTRFPLLGKHAQGECADCHADKTFAAEGTACADCHADDHHAGTLGTPSQCQSCHNSADWASWAFDHDRQSDFALTGQHRGLVCSACHSRATNPADTTNQCVECHRREDVHRGAFGEDCASCHVTENFRDIILPD
jgi:hypothetical protein